MRKNELPQEFWERHPKMVARDLVGRIPFTYESLSNMTPHGILTEVDAYVEALVDKGSELFGLEPGTIGMFSSRRGAIPIIAAHARGKTGLITFRKLVYGSESIGPREIAEQLDFENRAYSKVGTGSGLYIGETGINFSRAGLRVFFSSESYYRIFF